MREPSGISYTYTSAWAVAPMANSAHSPRAAALLRADDSL
jgi:hypothetical protein